MKTCYLFTNIIKTAFVIVLIILAKSGLTQPIWSKINLGGEFIEDYDRGYVFANGPLIKTDVNGDEIYRILLQGSNANQKIVLSSLIRADSNSIIAGGYKTINSTKSVPFICKFNKCKQIEWCRTINLPTDKFYCKEFISTHDNKYYCLLTYDSRYEKDVYIVKINSQGTLEWANRYCNTSTYDSIHYTHIQRDEYNGIILSGTTDFQLPIPDYGNHAQRPFWIRIDSAGNQQFDTIYKPNVPTNLFRSGVMHKGISIANGNLYYSGGSGFFDPVNDGFYKINKNNFSIQWHPFSNNSPIAMADWQTKAIVQVDENVLVMASSRQNNNEKEYLALFKTDTIGNLIDFYKNIDLLFNVNYIKATRDNKVLMSGIAPDGLIGGPVNYVPSTLKFNLDFEGGQLDLNIQTYDSLCASPILSDTLIPLNCSTLSTPNEWDLSKEIQIKISPNPASMYVTVEIPEYSVSNTSTGFGTQQQYRPLTGELQLTLMNLSGQTVKTEVFDASERNHVVNVAKLPAGMYVMHLRQKGKFVAQGKVVVVR